MGRSAVGSDIPGPTPVGPSEQARQLHSLTGLRFLCAIAVFFTHAWYVAGIFASGHAQNAVKAVLPFGMVGVSVFFVLSGFVLTWTAPDQEPPRAFWRRRAAKIYPNHVIVWTGLLVFVLATGSAVTGGAGHGVPWLPALLNLALVHAWLPGPGFTAGLNIVTWSLAVEVFCYAMFPFLLRRVRQIRENQLWLAAGVTVLEVWSVALIASLFHGGRTVPGVGVSEWQFWLPYFFPLGRLPEFLLGMLLARLMQSGRAVAPGMVVSGVAVVVLLGAALTVAPFAFLPAAVTIVPVAALILSSADADLRGRPSWLRRPAMVFLGKASFAFYVVHWPVIMVAHWALGGGTWSTPVALGATALFLLLAVGAAVLLHRAVELPAMRRFVRPSLAAHAEPPRPAADTPSPAGSRAPVAASGATRS
jgi:peptidoglycan/LPS O-acetylase OafA/YrhL